MELINLYQCLCDRTRLRILNLLLCGPLCVCHIQQILEEPQVKISKHLRYLKSHGMVETTRQANWIIYSLPASPPPILSRNLACLQDCFREDPLFAEDRHRRKVLYASLLPNPFVCSDSSLAHRQCP